MFDPQNEVMASAKELILKAAGEAVAEGALPEQPLNSFTVEIPADPGHGDLATNFAMVNAKALHMSPRAIASAVADRLYLDGSFFSRAEIAGPGFINLFYNDSFYHDTVAAAASENADYGRTAEGQGKKVMVEFVSANPTGPMHIGNARGGAIGDVLASALERTGCEVTREFYINDAGNQIRKFSDSLFARYMQITDPEFPFPEDGYHGGDITAHARAFAEEYGTDHLSGDETALKAALADYALPKNIAGLERDLGTYGINYDVWFHESSLYEDGTVDRIMSILESKGATYEQDGAIWLRTSDYLRDLYRRQGKTDAEIEKLELKDDVLRRGNGFYTYFAADIAYHYNKFVIRGFDKVINVWGADHHGHVARLKAAMDAVGVDSDKLDIVLMQMVELVRDGKPTKVSKRTGNAITLTDLLEEVPRDAARFFFNLREPNSHFQFDLDLAVKEEKDNPVYYVQYAHARICSILRALASDGYDVSGSVPFNASLLSTDEEKALIRKIAAFPGEIAQSAKDYDPSRITRYAIDTATLFHRFYTVCRVKDSGSPELTAARTALTIASRHVIANALGCLGVSAPEVM